MITRLPILALAALASLPAGTSAASQSSRSYGVSGFDRVRVDGPYLVVVKTGVPPSAKAKGRSAASLDAVSIKVEGRTLVVRRNTSSWGGYPGESAEPIAIEVGTHELSAAWLNGPGAIDIDKVKGLSFELSVAGAGRAQIASVDVDQFRVILNGSGTARLSGKTLKTNASLRGSVNLDGGALSVKDALVNAEGPSLARLAVSETAKINAWGLASVDVGSDVACTVKVTGSATVSGCKDSD